jgi:CheY-like chemotaxis protein/signal transduction histidine kinase/CHASE3 domain sensor protein
MITATAVHEQQFRKILGRNITLPLGLGFLSAIFFVILVSYLLSVLKAVTDSDETLRQANEAFKLTVDLETGMRGFLLTGDERFIEPYEQGKPQVDQQLQILRERTPPGSEQLRRLQSIQELLLQWDGFAQEMIRLRRTQGDYLGPVIAGQGRDLIDGVRSHFIDFVNTERQLRAQRSLDAKQLTWLVIGLFLISSLAASGFLSFFGRRELQRLSATYTQMLQQQQEHSEQLQRQAWLRSGQTQLAENILGQLELGGIARSTLQFLAGYLEFQVAALYLRESDGALRRIASYGFSLEQDQLNQDLYQTGGLVGQVAAGRQLLRLDNLPAQYLKVNSGLGNAPATSVLLVPTHNDERTNGVMEIGFLRPLQSRDIQLLELVAGSIGMAIETALYRERLQSVLMETQQLNEELQVQQEELRSSNEELEEQSQVLKESQAHMEAQQAELEQTNEQLAAQRDALDQKNAALNAAQMQLEDRADELQKASRYKSEFLANMSHELRTPLNSSLILAKLLSENAKGNLSEEQVRFAESIYSAGNDLLHLINDILDISKVEAGKLEVRPENTSVTSLVESLRTLFEPLAKDKLLRFEVQLDSDLPRSIFTDRQRAEQILKNLLSNAIKFTERGEVLLSVSRQGQNLAFRVQDSGIGIAQDQQQLVFEAFCQADGAANRRYGGTGLGLSISRDLAGLLGGQISVDSEPGQGSCFTLVLPERMEVQAAAQATPRPLAPARSPVAPTAPAVASPEATVAAIARFADDRGVQPYEGRTVLVIEDEPRFAEILYDLAHELRYNCLVAHGGDEGYQLAEQYLPAAILLDMRLPDHSGLTVLQLLKENPRTRHIPVHVISAEDQMEAALQLGAVGYARKPTTREQLKSVFARLEDKLTQKLKRILLVEDDARQRDSITHLIADDDVEVVAVEQGCEALEQLRSGIFDCMIIDLKLPDIQGDQLLQQMASEELCSFPPVIVYTGRNLSRDEEAELMKYSRSIIIKGARSPERLLDEVTLFLHKVESSLSRDRQNMLRTARNRDKVLEGRRILLVDDDVRNIFALASALEHKGAAVEVARNGLEALEKLAEVEDIDLILMDVMMPEMDGYEATARIRQNPQWDRLPIIAVTAKAMKDDQERCREAGANDYLAKPIDLDRLFSLIRVWMPKLERI